MTAEAKKTIAQFLDTAVDYLSNGYHGEKREYNFNDDENPKKSSSVEIRGNPYNPCEIPPVSSSCEPLLQIAEEIRMCRNCPLGAERRNAAPGEGAEKPLVMVIGEGPGQEEDAQGRPFVGKAGQLLDKMLGSIGLSRNDNCFIANIIKCRPPFNRDPHPEEAAACAHFLQRQITLLKPKFILAAGRIAAQNLLNTTEPIGKLRGRFIDYTAGDLTIPLLATYHPAALLRNEELKRPAWEDLKLLRSKLESVNGIE